MVITIPPLVAVSQLSPVSACEGGPSAVVRIACIGDSLTAGDNLHAFRAGSVKRCSMVDPLCRGNYPLDLADLLSGPFQVRNFGHTSQSVCHGTLPTECSRGSTNAVNRTLQPSRVSGGMHDHAAHEQTTSPILMDAPAETLRACSSALRALPLLREAMSFSPHVVVFMMGTNDARSPDYAACGGQEGFGRALRLMLLAIGSSASSPLTMVLPPPSLLPEYNFRPAGGWAKCSAESSRTQGA